MSQVVTRIAPSPTGYMHIGTARTALYNWLYARARGGKFLLRIEDTDRERSTPEATDAILRGMEWLGLDYDGDAISQFDRADRHAEVAHHLLAQGKAYKCFSTQDEIAAFREAAKAEKRSTLFQSPWRDASPDTHPDAPYVIRIKSPVEGETIIRDEVQGNVTIRNDQLDDMILLRSDGTPVYMLAVVVDDHDMGVTHVIRGDDHLNNAARQMMIYTAMEWPVPVYAHIPLIHGEDGKKLSKRHGATGVEEFQTMGYPAAAMRNYLARLGWSHGDDEFFTDAQALEWFDLSGINKSAARFDFKKLANLSGQHIAMRCWWRWENPSWHPTRSPPTAMTRTKRGKSKALLRSRRRSWRSSTGGASWCTVPCPTPTRGTATSGADLRRRARISTSSI